MVRLQPGLRRAIMSGMDMELKASTSASAVLR